MAISCAYCGSQHDTPGEVRECWSRHNEPQLDDTPNPAPSPTSARPTSPITPAQITPSHRAASRLDDIPSRPAPEWAGPDVLGRMIVLSPGQDVPEPWRDCQEVTISDATLRSPEAVREAVVALRANWLRRVRTVVRLDPAAAAIADPWRPPGESDTRALHDVGARGLVWTDHLHHLVWSNSVDGRDVGAARWWAQGLTDLVDGVDVWVDGGPLTFVPPIDGVGVLHRIAAEHGGRQPFTANAVGPTAVELAPDQHAAVTHHSGSARIIAPAGSGKTRVLTERARHLLQVWNLPPSAVSLVAFNTRAQREMRERTADLAGLDVRTLNSIALAIVNGTSPFAPRPRRRSTIDEPAVRRLLDRFVSSQRRRNTDQLAPWIDALSVARLGLRHPDDVEADYDGDVPGLTQVMEQYRQRLERDDAVDFDEQIVAAIELLLRDPAARAAAQRSCRVLLVDEFQDLTPAHLLLIRLLSGGDMNVFGVGDDDQTIYGYNGADPGWLIDFAELFPGAGDHPLEVNYRCPGGLVTAVDKMLRRNTRRVAKSIRAAHADSHGWSSVVAESPGATLEATVAAVSSALDSVRLSDVAVLARVNSLLAPVQVALQQTGVPTIGGVGREFLSRTAVRSSLAWLRLANGYFAADDIREALKRPSRPLHPRITDWACEATSVDHLMRLAGRLDNKRDAERIEGFAIDVAAMAGLLTHRRPTDEVLDHLFHQIGLAGAVSTLDATRAGMNRGAQGDDLVALAQLASLHADAASFPAWLASALDGARPPDSGEGVTLATVHRVKGQEWPFVIVHDAGASQFPHRLAQDWEEERRVFHVALTRAGRHVTVVASQPPSPFIEELTTEGRSRIPTRPPTAAPVISGRRSPDAVAAPFHAGPEHEALRAALKAIRLKLAAGKPAYTVFNDNTLEHIVAERPTTLAELSRLPGIGHKRLEAYGDEVLLAVEDYLASLT